MEKEDFKFGFLEWTKAILGIFVIVVLPMVIITVRLS